MTEQEKLAQVIADSFFAMEAGESWKEGNYRQPEVNTGDMQLAYDILNAGYGLVAKARGDAFFEAFGEASIQVLRDRGYNVPPSKFEGEYGEGAAAVMNWLNEKLTEEGWTPDE